MNSSIDFSSRGLSFESPREYIKGQLALLELPLEGYDSGKKIKILVSIAWCRKSKEGGYRVGAEIVAIDPTEKCILQERLSLIREEMDEVKKEIALRSKKKAAKKKTAKKKASKK